MNSSLWDIRDATETDLPFIYSTWLKSYRYDSLIGKGCRNTIFYSHYTKIIDHILTGSEVKVIMAAHLEDPKVTFGYLVYEPHIVHYVFVKEEFRKHGIAKCLYSSIGGLQSHYIFTHKTFSVMPITKAHNELIFNPFLLFKHFNEGDIRWQANQKL